MRGEMPLLALFWQQHEHAIGLAVYAHLSRRTQQPCRIRRSQVPVESEENNSNHLVLAVFRGMLSTKHETHYEACPVLCELKWTDCNTVRILTHTVRRCLMNGR